MTASKAYNLRDPFVKVHHTLLGKFNARVSNNNSIKGEEIFPILIEDEFIYIGQVEGYMVAWP